MAPGTAKRVLTAALTLQLTATLAVASGAAARAPRAVPRMIRVGEAPALPAGTVPLSAVAAARPMRITLALTPRDPRGLAAYAAAVSDPASPDYRRYLTVAQFVRRFAPAARRLRALEASLQERGLHPGRLSANGLAIQVVANAGAVEHAFALSLAAVRLPSGADAVVGTQAPALPGPVASTVQAVIGLSSLEHLSSGRLPSSSAVAARRSSALDAPHVPTGGPQPCPKAVGAAPGQSAYTIDQIASAYDFSGLYHAGDQGAGVTIAAYELESVDPTDIAAFQACYGTHAQISYVPVDGGVRPGPGSGEAALDIEQLIGLVPRARLLVYQAPNSNSNAPGSGPYDEFSTIIGQDQAKVISNSWGQCEPQEGLANATAENVLFEEAAVQGQTVLSSAGDSGSEDCDYGGHPSGNTSLQVDDPASQPFVTGVGGTSLTALGPPPTETVWNSGGQPAGPLGQPGAGGGGISSFWPMPPFQAGAPAALNVTGKLSSSTPCHGAPRLCREVPDVSADADPNYGYLIYYNGNGAKSDALSGWQGTGGTSAAAPLWAAVIALADASPACAGISVGFANPALYGLAGTAQATYFHNIASGDNDLTGTAGGLYPAGPGYSMAAGLGSPDAAALAPALCASSLRLGGPKSELTFVRTDIHVRVRLAAPAGAAVRWLVRGLPRGVRFDRARGVLTGRPLRAGRHRVTLEAIDSTGTVRRLRFVWTVDDRPHVTGVVLSGASTATSALSLTVVPGRFEPPLRSLTVRLPAGLRFSRGQLPLAVTGPTGNPLAYTASGGGNKLALLLAQASPAPVRVVFEPGSLVRNLRFAGRRAGQLVLGVQVATGRRQTLTVAAPVGLRG